MATNRLVFTKAALEEIPIPELGRRARLYDLKTRGLLIDVTASGTKTFYVRRKVNGRSGWHRIGRYPDLSIEQARRLAGQINADIAQGRDPEQEAQKQKLTLGEMFEMYIQRHASKAAKTHKALEQDFQRYLKKFKSRGLSSISNQEVEQMHQGLGEKNGIYAANRTVELLRAVYNKAILWKLFDGSNPAVGITLFKETSRERFLSTEEVQRLFAALYSEPNEDLRDFVWLSLLTGARKSNILSMRWQDVDLTAKTWLIPETKNGSGQLVPLSNREISLLDERRKRIGGDFVFPSTANSGHLEDPRRAWSSLLGRAQINDCTLHDLRRNLGSWMASENVNVALIKSALNHKDIKTTIAVYARTAKRAELKAKMAAHRAMFEASKSYDVPNFGKCES